ncbi:MAG: RagB/SusD family nutrient uptake outer membrane protein [Ferruginibacter sp.]|nr:RagB/SusD family nutrient uptake outer membrane protein [Ferruginibacter sp.]
MKSKISSIIFLSAILIFGSCSKELDTTPFNNIDQNNALKTSSDVEGLLVGAYADLGAVDLYGGGAFVTPDLLGDFNEIFWGGTYPEMTQIKNKAIPVDNAFVRNTWTGSYKVINDVNNVLSAITVVSAAKQNRVEGEAKFIRGSVYFDLVRLFAKAWNDGTPAANDGVPLKLTPTVELTGAADQIPRDKVSVVYNQVIKDLTEAEAKLPATNGFFASKYSAAAMLARVYLQKGDYAKARDAADRVIKSGKFKLTQANADGIIEEFLYTRAKAVDNTSEDVFAIQVNTTSGVNTFQTFYSVLGRGDITLNNPHFQLFESNDLRLNLFYDDGQGSIYSTKFDNLYGNVHIIRLAEMYLIRAEANNRLSTSVGATPQADVNTIRNRAGLASLTTVTIDDILKERKIELSFEGFTLHDIKRLGVSTGFFTGGGGLPFTSPKLIFPIPKRDRIVNPKLTQNEGY